MVFFCWVFKLLSGHCLISEDETGWTPLALAFYRSIMVICGSQTNTAGNKLTPVASGSSLE